MGNLPGVNEIRSVSRFGLSVVTIVFEDEMGTYLPRQLVQESVMKYGKRSLKNLAVLLWGLSQPVLVEFINTIDPKPDYDFTYSLTELRTIQDWIVNRQLTLVDGLIGVNALGGKVKQYEIAINPEELNAYDISIDQIFTALKRNNVNTDWAYIEKNHMSNYIRGEGLVKSGLSSLSKERFMKYRNGLRLEGKILYLELWMRWLMMPEVR